MELAKRHIHAASKNLADDVVAHGGEIRATLAERRRALAPPEHFADR